MLPFMAPYAGILIFIGEIAVFFVLACLICGFILLFMTAYSIRTGRLLFPRFMRAGLIFLEGLMRGLFRLFGIEDREFLRILVTLQNTLNKRAFMAVPVSERAVFMPQCLRSAKCPASLHPEGIKCKECGLCSVGYAKKMLEMLGYTVFIVPGSSFIKRMVKKYRPRAIIGIGCLAELKEGVEMSSQINVVPMGVVTSIEGCVETSVNWDDLFDIAVLGLPPECVPEELKHHISA